MRARLIIMSVAVTMMVVVAFFLPLAVLIEDLAESRAVGSAEREANSLARIVAAFGRADDPTIRTLLVGTAENLELGIAIEGGEIIGSAAGMTEAVSLAFAGRTLRVDEAGGVAVYVPVAGLDAATAGPGLGWSRGASAQRGTIVAGLGNAGSGAGGPGRRACRPARSEPGGPGSRPRRGYRTPQ